MADTNRDERPCNKPLKNGRGSDASGNLSTRPFTRSPRNSSKPVYNLSLSDVTSDGFTLQ